MSLTRRIAPGVYVTADGYRIERRPEEARAADHMDGWLVINPDHEWCNTFPTKAEALRALEEIRHA